MKWIKRFVAVIIGLPVALVIIWGMYQAFGMYVNHNATREQTKTLQMNLESEISESEEKEKILAKKYSVAKRTGIKIFMVVVVITVILICVFILRLLA